MKYLILLVVAVFLLLMGACSKPTNYIEGEIIEIGGSYGNIVPSHEYDGLVSHSNETIKFSDDNVVFTVKTKKGNYYVQIDPSDRGGSAGVQTVENLKYVLKKGMMVRFPTKYKGVGIVQSNKHLGFSKSRVGVVDPDDIEILE